VRSALEVDFVTHIQAQTDGPEISLDYRHPDRGRQPQNWREDR